MKKTKPIGYMVCYVDQDYGMRLHYGVDPSTAGALRAQDDAPVVFGSREEARQAVTISRRAAQLALAQGVPVNTDFTEAPSRLKIVPLYPAPAQSAKRGT